MPPVLRLAHSCTRVAASRLAEARAPTLLALASHPPVLADARAPALLGLVSAPSVLADLRAPALLALVSHPPVLADPLPRALLTVVSSVGLPVRALRTSRSLRLPERGRLPRLFGMASCPARTLWPRPRRTRGSDERFIFLGPIDASLAAPRTARFDHSPRFERALSVRRATPRTRSRRRGVDPARRIRPGATLRARRFASGGSSRSSARRVARSPRPRWWAVRRSNPPGCRARRTRRRTRGAWRGLARRTRTCPAAAAR